MENAGKLHYKNPVIFGDYSDPDVICANGSFYLVASSFNFMPGVPVLKSENLVEWKIVGYVVKKMPVDKFENAVRHGEGAWAPSLRFHGGKFYCFIPFPDEGIYYAETDDPEGEWSPLRLLIKGKGLIDPCPIWDGGRCFVAIAFAKSRAGFNSMIGVYEVAPDLSRCVSDSYTIVYDGHGDNPTIEGPKFYKRGKYFYILAPAGSVKSGWQVALRSENVYGPYESKIILMQGDTLINGPHQGALVTAPDGRDWFVHFRDMRAYGRIVYLQPVVWQDGWCLCGNVDDGLLAGTPVDGGEYPVQIKTDYSIPESDDFGGDKLSLIWQTPAEVEDMRVRVGGGRLALECVPCDKPLSDYPYALTAKITRKEFTASCGVTALFEEDGDCAGFGILGGECAYLCVCRQNGKDTVQLRVKEETVFSQPAEGKTEFSVIAKNRDIFTLVCTFAVNGEVLPAKFVVSAGRWVGAKIALFACNRLNAHSEGSAQFERYSVKGKE